MFVKCGFADKKIENGAPESCNNSCEPDIQYFRSVYCYCFLVIDFSFCVDL